MIRDRCNEGYDTWLADVAGSDARYLRTFAEEFQNDDAAVRAALDLVAVQDALAARRENL